MERRVSFTEFVGIVLLLWFIWVGAKVIAWTISDRLIYGKKPAPSSDERWLREPPQPTVLELLTDDYVTGKLHVLDFEDEVEAALEYGILDLKHTDAGWMLR